MTVQNADEGGVQSARLPLGGAGAPWLLWLEAVPFQTGCVLAGWVGGAQRTGLLLASLTVFIPQGWQWFGVPQLMLPIKC